MTESRPEAAERALSSTSVRSVGETKVTSLPISVRGVLCLTVIAVTVLHAVVALRSPSPWIVPDELIYSELAKSLGQGGLPQIRGEISFAYGLVYPALLAPVWAIFDDVSTVYAVAKVLNALILSLTVVPAFFLARRFVNERCALVVALLSVAVPSMLYAGTLMTEVALYPAFVLALLGIAAALERPAIATQAAALGAIGLASAVKMLAAILVVAYVSAVFLYHWLDTHDGFQWRGRLKAYTPTWIVLGGVFVVGAAFVVSGKSPFGTLGAYAVVVDNIDVLAVPWWALLHLAELDLYLAVIPFGATILVALRGLQRDAGHQSRLFAALLLPTTVVLLLTVAAYSSPPHGGAEGYSATVARLHERATFVLAPLFFVGLMVWLRERPLGSRTGVIAAFFAAAALPAAIPSDQIVGNASFQTLALVPWAGFDGLWPLGVFLFACVLAAFGLLAAASRLQAAAILSVISMVFVVVSVAAQSSMELSSQWTRDRGLGPTADWIDRAVGRRTVSVLWAEKGDEGFVQPAQRHRVLWLGEFFNRSVGPVYELGSAMPYGLPSTAVRLKGGRVVLEDGRAAPFGELVLIPCHVRVAGTVVTRDTTTGASVVRVSSPIRATVTTPESCARDRLG